MSSFGTITYIGTRTYVFFKMRKPWRRRYGAPNLMSFCPVSPSHFGTLLYVETTFGDITDILRARTARRERKGWAQKAAWDRFCKRMLK